MPAQPLRLNLGSGLQQAPGWVNYDRSRAVYLARSRVLRKTVRVANRLGLTSKRELLPWPPDTRVYDLTKGIPHPPESVDAIYSSHMLEHVDPTTAEFIIRECHRVLKTGGVLRIVVPDLKAAASAYITGDRDYFPSRHVAIGDAFVETLYLHPERTGNRFERAVRVVLRTDDGGHKWMYDSESLILRVRRAGFSDVERVAAGSGRDAEAAKLDSRSPQHIHLEAFKS
jgi:SAM-dependent methyltransferase